MVDLPAEIWLYIFGFVVHSTYPKVEALKLHGLNRHLREIALDYCFGGQPLNVAKLHEVSYFRKLQYLKEASIAFRVRRLYIGSFQPSRRIEQLPLYTSTSSKQTREERAIDEEDVVQLGKMICSLPNINFVNLYCGGGASNDFITHTPLVLSAMGSYSKTLRTLALGIASLEVLSLLFKKLPYFPQLERFSLTLSGEARDTHISTAVLRDGVLPFLVNHSNSLIDVAIHRQSSCNEVDFSHLYDNFPLLHKIRVLAADLQRVTTSVTALRRLIKKHSESLEDLRLFLTDIPANNETAMDECFSAISTRTPHIKHLTIKSRSDNPHTPSQAFVDYLSSHSGKLSTLSLLGGEILSDDWEKLSSVEWSNLITLDVRLSRAPAKVFDDLVKNLQGLRYLSLSVRAFSTNAQAPLKYGEFFRNPPDETEFLTDMRTRYYPNAQLTHLSLSSHNSYQTFYNATFTACLQAVVEAFPTVICVNDLSRMDFLTEYAPGVLAKKKDCDESCL